MRPILFSPLEIFAGFPPDPPHAGPLQDPIRPALLDPLSDIIARYQKDYFILIDLSSTLIEAAYAHIMGTENFFLYLFDEPELIAGVLDGLTEYYTKVGKNAIARGVDMVRVGDDVGAQQSMMLSPVQWRELAKPRFKYMFQEFRKANDELFIKLHSCGDYSPIIPGEVELGVDLSGLMQPTGGNKDQAGIKKKYGNDIAFIGGFDVQNLLPIVAGFVGADTVAAVVATRIYDSAETRCLVDIGTNGEVVMGIANAEIAELMLCGGFGNYINTESAVRIRLLPKLPLDRISYYGNAAVLGAQMTLLPETERARADRLAREIAHVSLASQPDFQDVFVEALRFQDNGEVGGRVTAGSEVAG